MRRVIETWQYKRGRYGYGCADCPAIIPKGERALCYSVSGDDRTFRYCAACVAKSPGLQAGATKAEGAP